MKENLPEYGDNKNCCDYCKKHFRYKEIILVDKERNMVFCKVRGRVLSMDDCIARWAATHYDDLDAKYMRYHGNT